MPAMQRFTDLEVWKLGHQMTLEVYRLTKAFPKDELYGLTSQLRRSMSSVPCNIAEGSKRKTGADYARFLNVAESSLAEAEYQVMLSRDLGFIATTAADAIIGNADTLARKLHNLRVKVEGASKG
ncbi:MAG: four helix bundle protein [Planctomycetes bacterium]|nr:four helix bundle protein [Planctomycetota bacterium]